MKKNFGPASPPEDRYFSRRGEHTSDLLEHIKSGALIVVTRLPGSKGRAISLILKELAASGEFRGVDSASREISISKNPGEYDVTETTDTLAFLKKINAKPDSPSRDGDKPLLRVNVFRCTVDESGQVSANLEMLFRFLTPQVRQNLFLEHKSPKDGGVIAAVVLDIQVPDIAFDIKGEVLPKVTPENVPGVGSVIDFDTRSFDRSFLMEVYSEILLEGEVQKLGRNPSFRKLAEEYKGNADFAMGVYLKLAGDMGRDGKSYLTFSEAFRAVEPTYKHLLTGQDLRG